MRVAGGGFREEGGQYLTLAPELRASSIKLAPNEAACSLYAAALMRVLPPPTFVNTLPLQLHACTVRMRTCLDKAQGAHGFRHRAIAP